MTFFLALTSWVLTTDASPDDTAGDTAPPVPLELERTPYLMSVGPNAATVGWRTNINSTGEVHYGSSADKLDSIIESTTKGLHHEVTLDGLSSDRTYHYAVYSEGELLAGGDGYHTVTTQPLVGTRGKARFWIIGDSGTSADPQIRTRDAALQFSAHTPPHALLHMGDMAYNSATDFELTAHFFGVYAESLRQIPTWPCFGNHEGYSSLSETQTGPYYDAFKLPTGGEFGGLPSMTEAYYSFDHANIHLVSINTYDISMEPGDAMMTWLEADLEETTQEWIVAFFHHAPYSAGSRNTDTDAQMIEVRENVLPVLESGGVDLVLSGHSHAYERTFLLDGTYETPVTTNGVMDWGDGWSDGPYTKSAERLPNDGTVYVVAGHGGTNVRGTLDYPVMVYSEAENGSSFLDVHENRLSFLNVRWDGVISDRVALVRGQGLLLTSPDGGESLGAGTNHDIEWATIGDAKTITLEYSCDAGSSWQSIATDIPNEGSYRWEVPKIDSHQALIRISSDKLGDESNGHFSIDNSDRWTAINMGDTWRYDDTNIDHGDDWLSVDFDDSAWAEGPTEIGFGETDEATILPLQDKPPLTYYFRKQLDLDQAITRADLSLAYDDGVAIWVNGELVLGLNVDKDLGHDVPAPVAASAEKLHIETIDGDAFIVGTNQIAVAIKASSALIYDLSFNLSLVVEAQGEDTLEICGEIETEPADKPEDTAEPADTETAPEVDSGHSDSANPDTDNEVDGTMNPWPSSKTRCGCAGSPLAPAALVLPILISVLRRRQNRS